MIRLKTEERSRVRLTLVPSIFLAAVFVLDLFCMTGVFAMTFSDVSKLE